MLAKTLDHIQAHNFGINAIKSKSPKFFNLGLFSLNVKGDYLINTPSASNAISILSSVIAAISSSLFPSSSA